MNIIPITIVCSIFGTLIAILGFLRYVKKDTRDEASNFTRFEVKLDNVGKGVDDIRLDNKDQGRRLNDINEKLARVDESTKSAHLRISEEHKRIDELEK